MSLLPQVCEKGPCVCLNNVDESRSLELYFRLFGENAGISSAVSLPFIIPLAVVETRYFSLETDMTDVKSPLFAQLTNFKEQAALNPAFKKRAGHMSNSEIRTPECICEIPMFMMIRSSSSVRIFTFFVNKNVFIFQDHSRYSVHISEFYKLVLIQLQCTVYCTKCTAVH